jgi:hypothetical protein
MLYLQGKSEQRRQPRHEHSAASLLNERAKLARNCVVAEMNMEFPCSQVLKIEF